MAGEAGTLELLRLLAAAGSDAEKQKRLDEIQTKTAANQAVLDQIEDRRREMADLAEKAQADHAAAEAARDGLVEREAALAKERAGLTEVIANFGKERDGFNEVRKRVEEDHVAREAVIKAKEEQLSEREAQVVQREENLTVAEERRAESQAALDRKHAALRLALDA